MSDTPKKRPEPELANILKKVSLDCFQDAEGKKLFPILHDLLSDRWKDGVRTRQGARLRLSVDGGCLRVVIECPTEGMQAILAVSSLASLLEALEKDLGNGKTHWGLTWARQKKNLPVLDDQV